MKFSFQTGHVTTKKKKPLTLFFKKKIPKSIRLDAIFKVTNLNITLNNICKTITKTASPPYCILQARLYETYKSFIET